MCCQVCNHECPRRIMNPAAITAQPVTAQPGSSGAAEIAKKPVRTDPAHQSVRRDPTDRPWHQAPLIQCAASALMPGTGQFMQGRFSTGLYFFAGSTAILLFLVFLVWTSLWTAAESAVPLVALAPILLGWLFFVCIGIRDVWQHAVEQAQQDDIDV